ncbi:methylmalonyl-CoA mutase [candidate division KSB1 bacterium]|nr:MAG: methylmalonyl-CoA mutase [candidate division KSB1 bacterium]
MEKKIRVLVGKLGLDGHDRGAKIIASALRDAGFEVIYSGLHQTPEMIVEAALQEDVDVIGISMLSGAHMTLFPRIMDLMKKNDMTDVLLLAGGTIPPDDAAELEQLGIGKVFGPGTDTRDIIGHIRNWAEKKNKIHNRQVV